MKQRLLFIFAIIPAFNYAQTVLLTDNFDSYTNGATIAAVSGGMWQTWSGGTGTAEDPFISNTYASSGTNSLHVYNTGAGAYLHDIVAPFPALYTSGIYELSMKYYVPAARAAYFNLGSVWVTNGGGYEYGIDVFFNADGSGFVTAAGTGTFTYTQGAWTDVKVRVNMSTLTYELFINSVSTGTGPWGATNGFGVIDIFGFGYTDATGTTEATSDFYVDDFELVKIIGVGTEELAAAPTFSIYPNPTAGDFSLNFENLVAGKYTLSLSNLIGQVVYSESLETQGSCKKQMNLNLEAGVYFLNFNGNGTNITKKITVR